MAFARFLKHDESTMRIEIPVSLCLQMLLVFACPFYLVQRRLAMPHVRMSCVSARSRVYLTGPASLTAGRR
jgi:hypothetical protein